MELMTLIEIDTIAYWKEMPKFIRKDISITESQQKRNK